MARKRGLAANRGLDALLGSIKKEKAITAVALRDDKVLDADDAATPTLNIDHNIDPSLDQGRNKPINKATSNRRLADVADATPNANAASASPTQSSSPVAPKPEKSTAKSTPNRVDSDAEMTLVQMAVSRLQAGKYQPRRDMSESALQELADSIRQHGVMQPIVIRPLLAAEDRDTQAVTHEIIAGERRWRAAKMAGQTTIPAIERILSDELAIALALIENIQREDLSVIEQAEALQRFHTEFNMSHAMIAEVVGKARTTVSNLLRLNHLHDKVKNDLSEGALDMGHARTLLALSSEQQPIIAEKIIAGAMTVRDAEKLVKSILNPEKTRAAHDGTRNAEIEKINQQLSERLGASVKLKQKRGGKGSVEIFFHSPEELEALLQHLQ